MNGSDKKFHRILKIKQSFISNVEMIYFKGYFKHGVTALGHHITEYV